MTLVTVTVRFECPTENCDSAISLTLRVDDDVVVRVNAVTCEACGCAMEEVLV